MSEVTRRSAITAALFAGVAAPAIDAADEEEKLTKDQEFVITAGLTKNEAEC